jgi:diguanylate cyclase (GGDEF)-like protein/PAS domain S-box-containing protein
MSFLGSRPRIAAAFLFVAIFTLRATVGSVGDAISFLYVIPVVIVAVALGVRGGLVAGAIAFALSSLGSIIGHLPVSALGYFNRALVYLFIGGLVGSFADRLRSLEAESARHFNLSLDMISTAGFDGCFKAVNPAFERILGYREEDLVGRPFLDFVHPDDRERTEQEAATLSDGRTTVQFQNRYFDSEGEVHWLEWASVPIPEEEIIYGVARDVTERKAMEEELERLSRHDPLTGVLNRRSFDEALDAQLNHARRYGRSGALLIVDVDRFKRINDELGHAVGDEALRTVARALDENLRSSDTVGRGSGEGTLVARLGGDEFAVLLSEADEAGADAAAQRLVAAVAAAPLEVERAVGEELGLSVSIGVACFDEHGCPPAQDLLVAADRAMYVVKAAGGGGASLAAASA